MVAEPVAVGNLPGDAEQIRDAGVDAVSLERARQLQGAVAVGVEETLVPDRDLVVVGAGHRAVPGTADDVADAGGVAYGVKIDEEPGTSLLDQARGLREDGWWQRLGGKYATYIAYEIEAVELKNFEPMLVPGLLQTESYAREVNVIGRETDPETIDQRVSARMTRQEVLRRKPTPLRMHAILSEASVRTEVGGPDVLHQQLDHLVTVSRLPNVTIQVLRFEAGAHLAISSGFALLSFERDEPPLGYIETLAGELFLESSRDLARLSAAYDNLRTLARSPAESIKFVKELSEHGT